MEESIEEIEEEIVADLKAGGHVVIVSGAEDEMAAEDGVAPDAAASSMSPTT